MVWDRSTKHVVRFHAQNTIYKKVWQKEFFNIVKDSFKSIEGLRRSLKVQIGSKANGIIVLYCLR